MDHTRDLATTITAARFTPVRLRTGYAMPDVDRLLARLAAAAGSGEGLAPIVAGTDLPTSRLREGYAIDEVDRFLDEVVSRSGGTPPARRTVPTTTGPVIEEQRGLLARLRGR